jgi:myo-inositol-1(or 4)-monophosphatase
MEEYKEYALDLAKRAGSILLEGFKSSKPIADRSVDLRKLVTKYDLESEKIIIGGIKRKYPRHNILSEEAGLMNRGSGYTWIIDPLDGTGNFTRKNPFFSISIALSYQNEIVLGIVYAPHLDEMYTAERGNGAFLNGSPISVSKAGNLNESSIVSCEGSDRSVLRSARLYHGIRPLVMDMRKLGSAAIESAWVACGRAEAYVATKINPWDVAAGIILVEEAGGKVTDFKGRRWDLKKSDLVLSNGLIHERLLGKINMTLESETL